MTPRTLYILIIINTTILAQTPEWINFYHGPGNVPETIESVAFDNFGNSYFSGYGYFTPGGQGPDYLTLKCNPSGVEVWSAVYDGPQNSTDRPLGIFVDNNGNTYVTGTSRWTPAVTKIVTLKYSSAGSLLWRTAFDSLGQSDGEGHSVWADNNGNIYITGRVSQSNNGYYNLVSIRMNEDGEILGWNHFNQVTNGYDNGAKIISDINGDVYSAGESFGGLSVGQEVILLKYNGDLDTLFWSSHVNGTDNSLNEFAVDVETDDTGNVYLLCRLQNSPGGTDFGVLKFNSDGGLSFRVDFDEAGAQDIPEDMVVDENGNIYVTGRVRRIGGGSYNDFVVIKYNNSGVEQWRSYYDGPNDRDDDPIGLTVDNSGNVFVCGESNRDGFNFKFILVKYNTSGGFEWEYVYDENVSSRAIGVGLDNNGYVYAAGDEEGTSGNQDFMAAKLSATVGVEANSSGNPDNYFLEQNYPNPFNPSTTIQFSIPELDFVKLEIFNTLGEKVATLVSEELNVGSYTFNWNAGNLSSGVFFYKLTTERFSQLRKMILLK